VQVDREAVDGVERDFLPQRLRHPALQLEPRPQAAFRREALAVDEGLQNPLPFFWGQLWRLSCLLSGRASRPSRL